MDVYTLRNNAIRNMLQGYVFATGTTREGHPFEIRVSFGDPNRAIGRGPNPERPALTTHYEVYVRGSKITTLANVEQATAIIRNNGWTVEE